MIRARDLVVRYGETTAVDGVSLRIDDGAYVAIVGPNGSGKTTLVRTFNGLVAPDTGTVLVDDTPVEADLVAARQAVGMVFQEPRDSFVAATVGADVAFGPRNLGLSQTEIDRRVETALAAVNLDGRADERIDRLSGGERERVAIAGALAMEPDHLVLDEPLTGLDEPARRAVLSRLEALHADGTSVIVVTHDLRGVLEAADRVIGMTEGAIAFETDAEAAREELAALDVYVPPETAPPTRQSTPE
ncbi:energy-coupling factor ABC transporter ATP-binding protein [Halohasta litorea]|uniref:Energy-coupling factor ABC transporter ATP-binding protein n=1 Tax=Halohasta litorea TaxID=869891 RepID=A0ABD6DCG9_9EURY|nr:ABC transporter ATP-binding protein [Halohasta litorea]